jgi:hypothetical protein
MDVDDPAVRDPKTEKRLPKMVVECKERFDPRRANDLRETLEPR